MSKGAREPVLPRALFMALWCALVVLLVTMVISTFVTEFTFISGYIALWKSLLRFLRLSANLALPLLLLPAISSFLQPVLNGFRRRLVRTEKPVEQGSGIKYVLLRPFQGIGLSMLFATKLLIFLQVYTGTKAGAATMLPSGHFALARFAAASIIGILVSITLSFSVDPG